ncbi:MAG: hypothetical protein IPJ85_12730 [Flavobacteriales bacterium]|nr:hypothetical protein [Flavobacteriales bacterium]
MRPLMLGLFVCSLAVAAQVPVPFVASPDRFMVFANGRFEKLEPRPPALVHAMDDRVVYRDHSGQLKVFMPEGRRLHLLDRSGSAPRGTRARICWLSSDTLKTMREGRPASIALHVEDFSVSDRRGGLPRQCHARTECAVARPTDHPCEVGAQQRAAAVEPRQQQCGLLQ